jgi:Periplasmic copper-binding protein (NosD)
MQHANAASRLFLAATFFSFSAQAGNTIHVPVDAPTIQAGIDSATSGDTVLVAAGTYPELINFNGKAIVLLSEQGAAVTTIDGQQLGTTVTMSQLGVLEGFTVTGGSEFFGAGLTVAGGSPIIRRNIFRNNAQSNGGFGAAIGGFSTAAIIEANEFFGNTCDAQFASGVLSFANSSPVVIFNNVIHDNPCRGINIGLPDGVATLVFNNTIVRNSTGIYIDHRISNASQVYRNNLIADNDIGLDVANPFTPFDATWTNNLVYGNTVNFSGTTDSTGTNGNVGADPRLENAAAGNFHLCPGSAAVDSGTTTGLAVPTFDYGGKPRVQDGNGDGVAIIDIGALEAAPPGPLALQCATALRNHGAQPFNLPLSLVATNPSTEPRVGITHRIVMTFNTPIASATLGIAEGAVVEADAFIIANDVIVDMTGVSDQQYVTIALTNVVALNGQTGGTGLVRIGFLAGDVNQNRVVSLSDLGQLNAHLSEVATWANFLKDVNASGAVTVADKGITNANLSQALPAP